VPPEPSPRIDTLTSLRFFAAFAIVLYHIPSCIPALYSGAAVSRLSAGVDFFFVLSGYVLGVTYSTREDFKVSNYLRRRFARIYPVFLLTTVVWAVLFLNSWPVPAQDKWNSGIAHLLLVNAFFSGFLFTLTFNAPAWTISCEAFFYVMFPLMRRRGALLIAIASLLIVVLLYRASFVQLNSLYPNFFGFFPPMVFWKFAAGLALAQLWTPRRINFFPATALEIASLALLAFAIFHTFPVGFDVYEIALVTGTLLTIAVFACQSGAISQCLLWPPIILLGEASYGLYLWHHMLMLKARDLFLPTVIQPGLHSILIGTAVIAPIIALSVITYLFFEVPLRHWISGRRT
jgi:peptidoglycan/LPS O-acetylase OafA/YrhL